MGKLGSEPPCWPDFRRADRTHRPDPDSPPPPAPGRDIATYTSRGISTDVYRYRCRLTVLAPADVIADRIGPTIGVITPMNEGSCELVAGSDSLDEVALDAGLLGHDFLVHEPVELREHIAALAARFARAEVQPDSRP